MWYKIKMILDYKTQLEDTFIDVEIYWLHFNPLNLIQSFAIRFQREIEKHQIYATKS